MANKKQQSLFWENESLSLPQKYARAISLFQEYGPVLQQQATISPLLTSLIQETSDLAQYMEKQQLGLICTMCAGKPGGSCCSMFMGNNTDILQLISNMLIGCMPTMHETDADSCPYLGPCGCEFKVKPIFCLNYNCLHIAHHLGNSRLEELTCASGKVLQIQLRLEEELLKHLSS
ncbi:hypothetical protein [Desulfogranum japonicum]|uniref:hypothetical protein n=1 Tax=Desulfogranum japonicum TaxID=231447 RepID=UPI000492082B|nr:hypothetical protein [Desulfogranum japonicum]